MKRKKIPTTYSTRLQYTLPKVQTLENSLQPLSIKKVYKRKM